MSDSHPPFVRLGDDGEDAPVLNYSVPEATSHLGTSVIAIELAARLLNRATLGAVTENRDKKRQRPRPGAGDLRQPDSTVIPRSDTVATLRSREDLVRIFEQHPSGFIYTPTEDMLGFHGAFELVQPKPRSAERILPKLLIFEKLQISTFLGDYGAGRVIKVFSLFPGERTTISIKSYEKTTTAGSTKVNAGSSILDSVTEEAAVDFENSVQSESSLKLTDTESDILNSQRDHTKKEGEGKASVLWGLVDVSGRGGSESESERQGEWGTRSAREEVAGSIVKALEKHASRASAKRDVEINTSSETRTESTSEETEEQTITRTLENVNVSRTLNLVFRQMVQEFVSVVHLVDVKIALYDETPGPYPQYSIHELDRFLDEYIAADEDARRTVREGILRELFFVFNHRDEPKQFLEVARLEFPTAEIEGLGVSLPERVEYLRVSKDLRDRLQDREFVDVAGVILKQKVTTMRTDGVIVDAFTGRGEALDAYSQGLQREKVRELSLENDLKQAAVAKLGLAESVVREATDDKGKVFRDVYCCCPDDKPQPHES